LISWRCAFEGSCAMAASISDNDFTAEKCQAVFSLSTTRVLARHLCRFEVRRLIALDKTYNSL
jgi:hypothetical protein